MTRFLSAVLLSLVLVSPSWAATILNSQGSGQAPVSVASSPVTILTQNKFRYAYMIIAESTAIRCTSSPDSSAPTVSPSATVGFIIPAGVCFWMNAQTIGQVFPVQGRLDCVSTGAATSVDTWEITQ